MQIKSSLALRVIGVAAFATFLVPSSLAPAAVTQEFPCGFDLGEPFTITGTPGDDHLTATDGDDIIAGLGGNDVIDGGAGSDVLCGGEGDDVLDGGAGDDYVFGGAGNDVDSGGSGFDVGYLIAGPVTASLETNTATGEGSDRFDSLEGLVGSESDDVLTGDGSTNSSQERRETTRSRAGEERTH